MSDITVKGFFEKLSPALNAKPQALSGLDCVFQFLVGNFAYNVLIKEDKATVAEGAAPSPDCTVTITENDFIDLVSGKLNGQMAFFTGKLKVVGNINLALRLGSLIERP